MTRRLAVTCWLAPAAAAALGMPAAPAAELPSYAIVVSAATRTDPAWQAVVAASRPSTPPGNRS